MNFEQYLNEELLIEGIVPKIQNIGDNLIVWDNGKEYLGYEFFSKYKINASGFMENYTKQAREKVLYISMAKSINKKYVVVGIAVMRQGRYKEPNGGFCIIDNKSEIVFLQKWYGIFPENLDHPITKTFLIKNPKDWHNNQQIFDTETGKIKSISENLGQLINLTATIILKEKDSFCTDIFFYDIKTKEPNNYEKLAAAFLLSKFFCKTNYFFSEVSGINIKDKEKSVEFIIKNINKKLFKDLIAWVKKEVIY